jgi:predicted acetyltransferase
LNVEIVPIPYEEMQVLKNLVKLYCHEWSQYNGIDMDDSGEYAFEKRLDVFWNKARHFAFYIKAEGKLAGFALLDDDFDFVEDGDYAMSEFFVVQKYRRGGIGNAAAKEIFRMFPGKWEIKMHPRNTASIKFWRNVVGDFSSGEYTYIEQCEKARYGDGQLGTIIEFECRIA